MSYTNTTIERFLDAQNKLYHTAVLELKKGKKETHWMWFVFPQLKGLGKSSLSNYYGIADIDEANQFMQHPILSKNLIEATILLLDYKNKSAEGIFGDLEARKLLSCMTLFSQTEQSHPVFQEILDTFFFSCVDTRTMELIQVEMVV